MAPILLKIKGTKLFSPFNEIEDVGDLSTLWRVCTKVKDSLENGSRLENLSWRLWHLHQTLEARGKGKDYRKLSPATTQQLERTIRRPEGPRKVKPMQIKVRLGKSSADRPDADGSQAQTHHHHSHGKQQQQQQNSDSRRKGSVSTNGATQPAPESAGVAAGSAATSDAGSDAATATSDAAAAASGAVAAAAGATPVSGIATTLVSSNDSTAAGPPALGASGSSDPVMVEEVAAASALASLAPASHAQAQADTQLHAQAEAGASEGVQASDFMSFGPSSFLSSGFDLDAPQIEITLDDIFSANSGDWSQFGFGALPAGAPLGLPGPMGEYGAASAIWGGVGYGGAMGGAFAAAAAAHAQHDAAQGRRHEGPVCENCGVTSTPLWRRSADDTMLCNACGLYYKLHNTHRPKSLRANAARKDGADDDAPKTVCSNCTTTNTPLWRRDEKNNPLCNACGLYYKLHKENRPITLKTDVIRKRQRYDSAAASANPRKRPAAQRQTQGTAAAAASSSASSQSPAPVPGSSATADAMGPPRPRSRKPRSKAPAQLQVQVQAQSASVQTQSAEQSAALQTQSVHTQSAPLSAPPVSYSANGTQLLNSADPGTPLHREHSLQPHAHAHSRPAYDPIQEYATDQGRNNYPSHTYQRRHTTASDAPGGDGGSSSQHVFASEVHPSALQQSMTHQPVAHSNHYLHYHRHHEMPRPMGASINIPMSPPLNARTDSYYSRTQPSLQTLPSLALSQSGSNRHASPTGSASTSLAAHASDGGRMYVSDRQLPSLAELASSAHPSDSFRYSRQQQQQQQPYSPLNQ
ncbi:Vacuolar protein-sorting-associated protein 33 [Coemansia sp. IMI 203386]|nr:Vacuolar protein-sorting-associated protein 33 [Coemansia sp. IMI 203386]